VSGIRGSRDPGREAGPPETGPGPGSGRAGPGSGRGRVRGPGPGAAGGSGVAVRAGTGAGAGPGAEPGTGDGQGSGPGPGARSGVGGPGWEWGRGTEGRCRGRGRGRGFGRSGVGGRAGTGSRLRVGAEEPRGRGEGSGVRSSGVGSWNWEVGSVGVRPSEGWGLRARAFAGESAGVLRARGQVGRGQVGRGQVGRGAEPRGGSSGVRGARVQHLGPGPRAFGGLGSSTFGRLPRPFGGRELVSPDTREPVEGDRYFQGAATATGFKARARAPARSCGRMARARVQRGSAPTGSGGWSYVARGGSTAHRHWAGR
jgi:hypothetical protein